MHNKKFNPKKLGKLNSPERLKAIPPDYIWNKLALNRCNTIVDIGAGTGLFTKAFLSLAGGGKAYAADISPVMVEWMEENLSSDSGKIIPMLMDESRISLKEKSVDLVLMFNLYHELEEPASLLAEAMRILREGGTICIVDWKKEKTEHGPSLDHRIGSDDIRSHLKTAGFSSIQDDSGLAEHSLIWAKA